MVLYLTPVLYQVVFIRGRPKETFHIVVLLTLAAGFMLATKIDPCNLSKMRAATRHYALNHATGTCKDPRSVVISFILLTESSPRMFGCCWEHPFFESRPTY
jgi:hypothetical protein